ncbi:MAG: hypothetical protein HQL56_12255 [Magnetococcales bacterium]|nr:hypothetical protein [Magnetococcales bacterium]
MISDPHRARILEKLSKGGAKGVSRSGLGIKAGSPAALALAALEKERLIGNLGHSRAALYVLAIHFNPLERACQRLAALAQPGRPRLFSRSQLQTALPLGAVRQQLDAALKVMLGDGGLIAIAHGRYPLYLHRASLPALAVPAGPTLSWDEIVQGYRRLVKRGGLLDPRIAELHRECGSPPLQTFREMLYQALHRGEAVASLGDASLSTEEERAAALLIDNVPHLRIRLPEK